VNCGEEREHHARDRCRRCYRAWYYAQHREKELARNRQWKKDNPEKNAENGRRYRARKSGATTENVDAEAIYELYNHTCIYCGSKTDLTLDHVVPLNGGGKHCEDNLVVACRSCNSSKKDTPLEEWAQRRPDLRLWTM
jgi:5-methylcytosine-specific restriction endonuclease McrA